MYNQEAPNKVNWLSSVHKNPVQEILLRILTD